MPNGRALQIHLLSVPEGIAALAAPGAGGVEVVVVPGLQHLARDEAVAVGTLHPVLLVVVLLAIGAALVTHVLTVEQHAARRTLEAPDVILFVQRHQGLAVLQLLAAAGAAVAGRSCPIAVGCGRRGGGGGQLGGHQPGVQLLLCMDALLTEAVLPRKGDPLPGGEGFAAARTCETLLVEGVAEGGDHLALHILVALGTLGAVVGLVALGAEVFAVLREEAA